MKWTIILAAVCLSGCDSTPKNATSLFNLPSDLKDCQVFYVSHLTIVRCPNSDVSVTRMQGKVRTTTVTIDGKEYVEKESK